MPSVGDIFVQLGFNVDDRKLKEFDGGIRNLTAGTLAMYGAIGGALYSLHRFVSGSMDAAAGLQSISAATGLSTDYVQKFGIAWNRADPSTTIEAADGKLAAFAKNLGLLQSGMGGNADLFNRLGISWVGKTPQELISEIATAVLGVPRVQANALLGSSGLSDAILFFQKMQKDPNYIENVGGRFAIPPEDLKTLLRGKEILSQMNNELTLMTAKASVIGFELWETSINKAEVALATLQANMNDTLRENGGKPYKEGSLVEWLTYTGQGIYDQGKSILTGDAFKELLPNGLAMNPIAPAAPTTVNVTINAAKDPQETGRAVGEIVKRTMDQRAKVVN